MAGTYDAQLRHFSVLGSKEIKASANYGYITNGITLKGSAFADGATVLEGQCLAREKSTGKYVPYSSSLDADNELVVPGAGETGADITVNLGKIFPSEDYDNPVVLDQSIKFQLNDAGDNPDVICGQVLVWGAVYEGQLIGVTDAFKEACPRIGFVTA